MAQGNKNNLPQPPDKQNGKGKPESKAKGGVDNSITLDAKNPIPIEYNSNIFVSLKGKKYVPFLNPLDHFFQFLTEAKLLSSTTLSCVNSKSQYCLGNGIYFKNLQEQPKDFKEWAANVNRKNQSISDILGGGFNHYWSVGNGFIQVVKGEVAGKRFIKVYLRNYLDCRLSSPDDDDICNSVYISKYFRKLGIWNLNSSKTEEIPIYSPNMFDNTWAVDEKGFYHTIFHIKHETGGYDYYGLPSNIGSLPEQLLEYKAARYNLDNFENNLIIGGVIAIKGAMTDDEAKKTAKNIIYQHSGDGKQGRWIIINSEQGMPEGIQVESFDKQKEGSFIESDTHNEEKIYLANQWNKLLIGGSEKKGIGQGNSAYVRSVFDIANNTVIMPAQQFMIEKFVTPLLKICDEWMGTNWSSNEVAFHAIQPVSFLGDIDVNAITTKDEGREIMGMDPLKNGKGDEFIKTAPAGGNNNSQSENPPSNVPNQ